MNQKVKGKHSKKKKKLTASWEADDNPSFWIKYFLSWFIRNFPDVCRDGQSIGGRSFPVVVTSGIRVNSNSSFFYSSFFIQTVKHNVRKADHKA